MHHSLAARVAQFATAALTLLGAESAMAAMIVIDSDSYALGTDVSNAVAGVTLSTVTHMSGQQTFDPVYIVDLPWPGDPSNIFDGFVGSRLFGHTPNQPHGTGADFRGSLAYAYDNPFQEYRLFRADFAQATDYVEIRSAFLDWYADDVQLWAFDANGVLLSGCHTTGTGNGISPISGSSALGPPTQDPAGLPCGKMLSETDCVDMGGGYLYCDRVYSLRVARATSDIAYITFGGYYDDNTPAHIDQLAFRGGSVPEPGPLALFGLGLAGLALRRRSSTN